MADQPLDTSSYVYLCMTAHHWGKGKTPELALRYCREQAGSDWVKKYGYVTYHLHPDFEVNIVNGQVSTPIGHPAIKVTDKIVRKKSA